MKKYLNISGKSGVLSYEIGKDYIAILFIGEPSTYVYSHAVTGRRHVEKMKRLAEAGSGLSTYISQHAEVRDNFDKR